jgi:hypothetical protein
MAGSPAPRGLLQVLTPDEVTGAIGASDAAYAANAAPADDSEFSETRLAGHIRSQWEMMRRHRNSAAGWSDRLLAAQRTFNGEYDASKLAEIRKFGGSEVYARVTSVKCRGTTSLLREVYLGPDRPWGLDPTPDPTLPDDVMGAVRELVMAEAQAMAQAGQMPEPAQMRDRIQGLVRAAHAANKQKAREEAQLAEDKLDDLLVEGGFYKSLAEALVDLPIFPFACVKGPVVRIVQQVKWVQGRPVQSRVPKMFWQRVSPFDVYFSPGVADIADADVIERTRLTRSDLNALIGVPGYDEEAIRAVLREFGRGGLRDWMDPTDAERALNENRENPNINESHIIDCLEYHGSVQGSMLQDWGLTEADGIEDPDLDYFVQAWLIGRHVIKVQISPSPRKRHPYFITSFEKVPGTPVGNALPDILGDVQNVCNATLRALVNNLSIASGPQVVVDQSKLANGENGAEMYPWKRWFVQTDPMQPNPGSLQPIYFFQPNSNSQELMTVYNQWTQIADELSAIPRYITGSDRVGGAGRTASGLAMLMGNASKILQTVAANVDRDILQPLLQMLYDYVMLTDESGLLRGDESIRVRGVEVAVQRETNRQRQLEALQATANPIDMQILGIPGRAKLLRAVLDEVGIEGEIVPSDDQIASMLAQQQAVMNAQAAPGGVTPPGNAPGNGPGPGGGAPLPKPANTDLGVQDAAAMRGMGG